MILTLLLALAAGCSNNKETDVARQGAEEAQLQKNRSEEDDNKDVILDKFRSTVKQAKEAAEILSYLNENMSKAGQRNADTMIRELNAFYTADLDKSQDAFVKPNVQEVLLEQSWPITSSNAASIEDKDVRQLVVTKLSGGYKLEQAEGTIFPIVDYAMQIKFTSFLSEEMNNYVQLKAVESDEPAAKDGGLVITWKQLSERAVMAEAFVAAYPGVPEAEEALGLYLDSYLPMYIYGLNNTPVFDYDTYKLKDEVKDSYKKIIQEQPDTVTAVIVERFLKVLEHSNGMVYENREGMQTSIPAVTQFHERFQAEAKSLLLAKSGT
ncbi:hypothetical protein [Paenibacillus sp. NPDC058071]|uniref:hypothetical protein n=1 Tax=Paenibacillus sp. NPDC058071 TaxID=3346326 RepID=UPI0036DC5566